MLLTAIQEKIQLSRHKGSLVAPSSPEVILVYTCINVESTPLFIKKIPIAVRSIFGPMALRTCCPLNRLRLLYL